jgi:hypothetical protein
MKKGPDRDDPAPVFLSNGRRFLENEITALHRESVIEVVG